jgi:hypothetical protein
MHKNHTIAITFHKASFQHTIDILMILEYNTGLVEKSQKSTLKRSYDEKVYPHNNCTATDSD